tara:strand:- start:186 stop:713 length:528 start_codon:yes stop_codon:yes gene_type:complete
MSKKKTSTFYLTERLTITAGATEVTATIDLGAYVDVANRQGIAIEAVDFIYQGTTADERMVTACGADADVFAQVFDLNRGGTIQFADDRALVASGTLTVDSNNIMSNHTDMYPDLFGAKDGVRIVVNDQLYLTALSTAVASSKAVNVTVRIKAHVASLSQRDYMAIAIQSTAADN